MADDIQPVVYPTGASGLAPPVITYGSLNLQPILTALQQRSRNAQQSRQLELELAKMDQAERLALDMHAIDRERIAAEGPLRTAQIENYGALSALHRAQTKATVEKGVADTEDLTAWQNDFKESVTAPIGSSDWQSQALGVYNNHLNAMSTTPGQRVWKGLFGQHKAAAAQAWAGLRTESANYKQVLDLNKLSDYDFQNPDVWKDTPDGKGKQLLKGPDGLPLVQTKENLDKANKIDPVTQQPLAYFKTLPKATFDNFVKSHKNYATISAGIGLPAVNPFTGRPYGDEQGGYPTQGGPGEQQQKPLDNATAAAILEEAGGDRDKARALARSRGYTF